MANKKFINENKKKKKKQYLEATGVVKEINVHEIYGNVIANLSAFTLHFLNCDRVSEIVHSRRWGISWGSSLVRRAKCKN